VAVDAAASLTTVGDEAIDGDRPELVGDLVADPAAVTEAAYQGLRWRGAVAWQRAVGVGTEDFGCPGIEPLELTYTGDVDFVRFAHRGGSLCVTVATPLEGVAREAGGDVGFDCPEDVQRPLWEAPLYAMGDDECLTGSWLNVPDGRYPTAIGLRDDGLFFPSVPAGDYALFVAPVCGRYAGAEPCDASVADDPSSECVPYDLAISVVPSQAACQRLHDDLKEQL